MSWSILNLFNVVAKRSICFQSYQLIFSLMTQTSNVTQYDLWCLFEKSVANSSMHLFLCISKLDEFYWVDSAAVKQTSDFLHNVNDCFPVIWQNGEWKVDLLVYRLSEPPLSGGYFWTSLDWCMLCGYCGHFVFNNAWPICLLCCPTSHSHTAFYYWGRHSCFFPRRSNTVRVK